MFNTTDNQTDIKIEEKEKPKIENILNIKNEEDENKKEESKATNNDTSA